MPRRSIDEFELGATLGVGTVGTIYLATERKTGASVAVKLLHPAVSRDPLVQARFKREMTILEKLTHPNVVAYKGGGRHEDQLFYAMELMDAGTLRELLEYSGRLSWQETVACGVQICSALQYLHNHGIIHRDLKPSNLFLSRQGQIKLGDFGIARDTREEDITVSGLTVGSHAYMSPEQIVGQKAISGKTDLYGLGCLLTEMLVGRPPFEGDNFAQLFEQHLHRPAPSVRELIDDCPAELDRLIAQLLEKQPDGRPFNARQVQAALMRLQETSFAEVDASADVGAAGVVDQGALLIARLAPMLQNAPTHDVSWPRLVGLILAIVGAVALAWRFAG